MNDIDNIPTNFRSTDGVRKSKRGQVPLRNTWVHSVSEPFKFTFFERAITESTRRKRKRKSKSDQTTRDSTQLNENTPSTSRSQTRPLKRKRQAEQDFGESGISPLPEITEEDERQETAHESPKANLNENEIPRKRTRRRKLKSDSDTEREAAAGAEAEAEAAVQAEAYAEAVQLPEQLESGAELGSEPPPSIPRLDTSQTQLLQMADFLRGVELTPEADIVAENAPNDNTIRFSKWSLHSKCFQMN